MNNTVKLLAFAVAILVVLAAVEAYMLVETIKDVHPVPIRVACVGDSITRGTEYTIDLGHKLGNNYLVGNFGIGGATVDADSGSGYINETAFTVAKDFQPNIVVIMLGTNDANPTLNESAESFLANYKELVVAFQELDTKPQVWLVEPPPIFMNSGNLNNTELTQKIIPSIRQLSQQMNLPIIDVNSPLLEHQDYFIDGIHPKVNGARIIAETIYSAIITTGHS